MTEKMKKIVIKVQVNCDKCRAKAMKVAASAGAVSISFEGEDRDHLVIVGNVDVTELTKLLRKKLGRATIVSLTDAKNEGKEAERVEDQVYNPASWCSNYQPPSSWMVVYDPPYDSNQDGCFIM